MRWMLGVCVAVAGQAAAGPVIDGSFDDWAGVPSVSDPAGDASGPFDLRRVWASGEGSRLAVSFEIAGTVNLPAGSSGDGDLFLRVTILGGDEIEIDFRGRQASLNGSDISWFDAGWGSLPTFGSDRFEGVLDLSGFGVGPGDSVQVQFAGRDALPSPINVVMGAAVAPPPTSTDRPPQTDLRIASLNTLRTGLFDSRQDVELARLIDAVDADIYCLQEEYDSSASDIEQLFNQIDPLENGASWTAIKNGSDEVIVTSLSIADGGNDNFAYVTGLVDVGDTGLLVMSIHPKCCGSVGSSEDATRVSQHIDMAATIADFRAGQLSRSYPDSPVVVIGDWNLVGGREPLDVLLDPQGPGLSRIGFPLLNSGDQWSWRDLDGFGFPPGRLDLGVYSEDSIALLNSFTLDTRLLSSQQRSQLGVQFTDSDASDHLMLVADFRLGPAEPCADADITTTNTNPGDTGYGSGDGVIDGADISYFVEQWLVRNLGVADITTTNTNPGDAGYGSSDGLIDGADLSFYVESWLAGCP